MSEQQPPLARREFARRLRELRIRRGFRTARSLAAALAIDENRYTRYERAEVEPDIGLIQRICQTLRLSPDALLGTGPDKHPGPQPGQGFAEPGDNDPNGLDARARVMWLLASAVADLLTRNEPPGKRQLIRLQQAARVYSDLERRSFAAVSEILLLPVLSEASPEEAQNIGRLVEELARQPI